MFSDNIKLLHYLFAIYQRAFVLQFIEEETAQLMPNFTKIASPQIAGKMLAKATSLQRLALMPSSGIQLLGAEKSLFRHMKHGGKPPKHGILYQHSLVKRVSKRNKGKMARTLAGKLSIALKEDYFGKKDISKQLLEKLERRAKELQ